MSEIEEALADCLERASSDGVERALAAYPGEREELSRLVGLCASMEQALVAGQLDAPRREAMLRRVLTAAQSMDGSAKTVRLQAPPLDLVPPQPVPPQPPPTSTPEPWPDSPPPVARYVGDDDLDRLGATLTRLYGTASVSPERRAEMLQSFLTHRPTSQPSSSGHANPPSNAPLRRTGPVELAFEECLELARREGLEKALARYPQYHNQLLPLLEISQNLERVAGSERELMVRRDAIRHRLIRASMDRASQARQPTQAGGNAPSAQRAARTVVPQRRRFSLPAPLRAAAILLLVLTTLLAVALPASANSLPGDLLYPVKLGGESVSVSLAPDDLELATVHFDLADRRANEIWQLADLGKLQLAETPLHNMDDHILLGLASYGLIDAAVRAPVSEHLRTVTKVVAAALDVVENAAPVLATSVVQAAAVARNDLVKVQERLDQISPADTPIATATSQSTPTGASSPAETPTQDNSGGGTGESPTATPNLQPTNPPPAVVPATATTDNYVVNPPDRPTDIPPRAEPVSPTPEPLPTGTPVVAPTTEDDTATPLPAVIATDTAQPPAATEITQPDSTATEIAATETPTSSGEVATATALPTESATPTGIVPALPDNTAPATATTTASATPVQSAGDEATATPAPPTEVAPETPLPPTATTLPGDTPLPTETPLPPTATLLPATATPPPTATALPPTDTPLPPTATPLPPTATPLPPTATPLPPTDTPTTEPTETPTVAPTDTAVPTVTAVPSNLKLNLGSVRCVDGNRIEVEFIVVGLPDPDQVLSHGEVHYRVNGQNRVAGFDKQSGTSAHYVDELPAANGAYNVSSGSVTVRMVGAIPRRACVTPARSRSTTARQHPRTDLRRRSSQH